jgi:hypothetical protein
MIRALRSEAPGYFVFLASLERLSTFDAFRAALGHSRAAGSGIPDA